MRIIASISDVLDATTGLTDYVGSLRARTILRATDRLNGPTAADAATVSDFPLDIPVPCTATLDLSGSTCQTETTADAVIPGMVVESRRTIWELGAVQVYDQGPDGRSRPPTTPCSRHRACSSADPVARRAGLQVGDPGLEPGPQVVEPPIVEAGPLGGCLEPPERFACHRIATEAAGNQSVSPPPRSCSSSAGRMPCCACERVVSSAHRRVGARSAHPNGCQPNGRRLLRRRTD